MMKRKLILLAVFVCSSLFAQTDTEKFKISKSKWVVGGNLKIFNSTNQIESEFSSDLKTESEVQSFNPNVGYAIKDNLITGISVNFGTSKDAREGETISKLNSFGVAPYIQQYIPMGKKFAFDVKVEISYLKSKRVLNDDKTTTDTFFVGFRPGLTLKLNDRVALQTSIGSLGYSNFKNKNGENKRSGDSFDLDLDLSLKEFNFGILVML